MFWMVARRPTHPGAVTAPSQRFTRRDDALQAAQALADKHGADFVVGTFDTVVRPGGPGTRDLFGKDLT